MSKEQADNRRGRRGGAVLHGVFELGDGVSVREALHGVCGILLTICTSRGWLPDQSKRCS